MVKVDTVTIPRAVYEDLEEKAIMLDTLNIVLGDSGRILKPYTLKAVLTEPSTGPNAMKVLEAVRHLIAIAKATSPPRH